jgi:polyphosphate kinase 2 (PPK2 family)
MFEAAEVGHKVSKEEYHAEEPQLRADLLDVQMELAASGKFAVLILIGGVDGAGKGETVNMLNAWMDPRHIRTVAFGDPSDEEAERPPMWRFWRELPARGRIGIMFGSWYTEPIIERVANKTGHADLLTAIDRIQRLESMLFSENVLLLKFWFHLSKDRQRKRLRELETNPDTKWRVTKLDWQRFEKYDEFRSVSEVVLRRTSTAEAPWVIVEGEDPRYRYLTVGRVLLTALRRRMDEQAEAVRRVDAAPLVPVIDNLKLLRSLDLSQRVDPGTFDRTLETIKGG